MAESPPPMTAISLPEKKNPSQVAHEETPWPIKAFSLGRSSQRAEAPLAMMSARVSSVSRPRAHFDGLGAKPFSLLAQIDADHMSGLELRAETRRLLAHVVDEFRPLDAVRKAGEILDQGGDGELSAGLMPIDDQRAEIGAGGVDGGGQPRTSGADDDDVANVVGHRSRNRFREAQKDAGALHARSRMDKTLRLQLGERKQRPSDSNKRRHWRNHKNGR